MPFFLCHECFSWVEPTGERCSQCQLVLDVSAPDPPLRWFEEAIGDLHCQIGEVHVRRRMLPDRGMLYATANGLFFLPHQLAESAAPADPDAVETSLLWTVASLVWTPFAIVLPFVKAQLMQSAMIPVFEPHLLKQEDSHLLPVLLMQNPGVFFVPNRSIRLIRRQRTQWRIDRTAGPPLKLNPVDGKKSFQRKMAELVHSRAWHGMGCNE